MKLLYSFCLFIFMNGFLHAQVFNQVGGNIGYSNYLGDLIVPTFTFNQSSLAVNAFGRKQINENFSLRSNLLVGRLKGDDAYYDRNWSRGNSFTSTFFELSVVAEYDLLGKRRYPKGEEVRDILSPYFFAGLGFSVFSQTVHYGSGDNPDISAVYGFLHPAFPIGIGFKKDLNKNLQFELEWGARITFSDYIDGVKLSGDPTNNDVYFFGGIGLTYRLSEYVR